MARVQHLQCPFCENYLIAPIDIKTKTLELTGGICKCRAVYVLDRTGHNLGEIFMDALTFVCKGDLDRALSLAPEDYESVEYDYDLHANTVGKRSKSGKLCKLLFIRLKIREA
jgi:hypothetical protein